jgi:hypothetical protein
LGGASSELRITVDYRQFPCVRVRAPSTRRNQRRCNSRPIRRREWPNGFLDVSIRGGQRLNLPCGDLSESRLARASSSRSARLPLISNHHPTTLRRLSAPPVPSPSPAPPPSHSLSHSLSLSLLHCDRVSLCNAVRLAVKYHRASDGRALLAN